MFGLTDSCKFVVFPFQFRRWVVIVLLLKENCASCLPAFCAVWLSVSSAGSLPPIFLALSLCPFVLPPAPLSQSPLPPSCVYLTHPPPAVGQERHCDSRDQWCIVLWGGTLPVRILPLCSRIVKSRSRFWMRTNPRSSWGERGLQLRGKRGRKTDSSSLYNLKFLAHFQFLYVAMAMEWFRLIPRTLVWVH